MMAAGDEFRFGTLLGVPNIFQESSNIIKWPDTWSPPMAPSGQRRIEQKSVRGADVPMEVCVCKKEDGPHIRTKYCYAPVPTRRLEVQGDFVYALSRNDIRYPIEKESASKFSPDFGVENYYTVYMNRMEWELVHNLHCGMSIDGHLHTPNSKVVRTLMLKHGLVVKLEWQKESSQFLVDWWFTNFRNMRGLFYINAIEHYTGYTMDIDKLHKSVVDMVWSAVRHFFRAGQDIFSPKDQEGLRSVELRTYQPDQNMQVQQKHQEGVRLDVQGDTEYKIKRRVPPTFNTISQVILDLDERSHEQSRNYRMAMSELEQKVLTAHCEVKFTRSGSPHIPIFSAEMLFLVDCGVYNEQMAAASSERKADAYEDAAKQLFLKLVKIAEDNQKASETLAKRSALGWEYGHIPNLFYKEEERLDSEEGKFAFLAAFEGVATAEKLAQFYEELEQPVIPMLAHFTSMDWFSQIIIDMGYLIGVYVASTRDEGIGHKKTTITLSGYQIGGVIKSDIKVELHSNKRMYPDVGIDFTFGEAVEIGIRSAIMEMLARERPNWAAFRGEKIVQGGKL
jgi:hypothetical protein